MLLNLMFFRSPEKLYEVVPQGICPCHPVLLLRALLTTDTFARTLRISDVLTVYISPLCLLRLEIGKASNALTNFRRSLRALPTMIH
jgi:hypothetical protein